MSQPTAPASPEPRRSEGGRHPITFKRVVYEIPGMEHAIVRRDDPYATTDSGALLMDRYYPASASVDRRLPAVIVVLGYPPREPNPLGCSFREMAWSVSWGQLIAASGLVAIFYSNRDPDADLRTLVQRITEHAESLGIDAERIALFATSGNAPVALSMLMDRDDRVKCAVLSNPHTLDTDGSTGIAEAAQQWGFVNATAGRSIADLPETVPLFIARAGRDEFPHLNERLDRFVADALARNLPVTVVNHADAPHGFDLAHDSETSREIIRQILRFLQFHLKVES